MGMLVMQSIFSYALASPFSCGGDVQMRPSQSKPIRKDLSGADTEPGRRMNGGDLPCRP